MRATSVLQRLKSSPRLRSGLGLAFTSLALALFWFLFMYGRFGLYTSHVGWIYAAGEDLLKHQVGWEWFRQEGWHFPLGWIHAFGYPFGTSITFLDSIPLLAIPFKLISPLLGQNFQYIGLWELLSLWGQILFGMLILRQFRALGWVQALGGSLLALAPTMLWRAFNHPSLAAHWILLAGIWFTLLEFRGKLWRGAWFILFGVSILVHAYYIPMLLPLWLASLYLRWARERKPWQALLDLLAGSVIVALLGFVTGLFKLGSGSLSADGFGSYSWNLNGLFNPLQYSAIFKDGIANGSIGQYEGFSYLGLGGMLVLGLGGLLYFQKDYRPAHLKYLLPMLAACVPLVLFALSNQAYLNTQPLWKLELPDGLMTFFSFFRSSGRFIWPVFYLLLVFGLVALSRNLRYPAPILALALLLQLVDTQPLYSLKRLPGLVEYQSPLRSEVWQAAADANEHILLLPALKTDTVYQDFAIYAIQNDLTLNTGYFARGDYAAIEAYAADAWTSLQAGEADARTMYVFWNAEWQQMAKEKLADSMILCQADEMTLVLSADNAILNAPLDLPLYCSVPSVVK